MMGAHMRRERCKKLKTTIKPYNRTMRGEREDATLVSRQPKRNGEGEMSAYVGEYFRTLDDGSLESQRWK